MLINIDVVILAAGLSTRMGIKNKLLLDFQKSTIIESTISNIIEANFQKVVMVLGHEENKLRAKIGQNFPQIEFVNNSDYQSGQVSSIKAGLKELEGDYPFMIALGDMPFIEPEDYRSLVSTFINYNSVSPTILRPYSIDGRIGNPVVFDYSFKDALLNNEELDSSKSVIQKNKKAFVKWETNMLSFFKDIDTEIDYRKMVKKS